MPTPSTDQIRRAIAIAEQIQQLQSELARIVGGSSSAASATRATAARTKKRGKRTMSQEARARIAVAARARWAKVKGTILGAVSPLDTLKKAFRGKAAKSTKKKGGITPEGRAKLAAAMKARWAARKKGVPALNAPAKPATAKKKRNISPEARAKMAAAAKKRWAVKKTS